MWRVWPVVVPCFACSFVTSFYVAGVRLRSRACPMTFQFTIPTLNDSSTTDTAPSLFVFCHACRRTNPGRR
jgi:hypothetical protein